MTPGESPLGDTLDPVERLVAIEAIKVLKARYFRMLDTRQWDAWAALFTPDCRVYCQPDVDAVLIGPGELIPFVRAGITPGVSVHHGHMPEITIVSRDEATGVWAMADIVRTTRKVAPLNIAGTGHYFETYARDQHGTWQISSLRLTRLVVDDLTA